MPIILWNPFSISYLVELILVSLVASHYLNRLWVDVRSGKNKQITASLFITFAALSVSILLQFLKASLHSDYMAYVLPWISPTGIIALCGFIHFAYRFPTKLSLKFFETHSIKVLYVIFIGVEFFTAFWRYNNLRHGFIEFRPAWMDLLYIIGFIWALLIFFRQIMQASEKNHQRSWFVPIYSAIKNLFWISKPASRQASVARAFLYISLLPLLLVFTLFLRSHGVINSVFTEIAVCGIFLILIFGFAMVFLNYAPDRSSFRVKLVGITLITVLGIMSGVAWVIGPIYVDQYEYDNLITKNTSIRFEPTPNGGYLAKHTSYRFDPKFGERIELPTDAISLPFIFPFYGETYKQLYVRVDGLVGFNFSPIHKHIYHRFGPQPALYPLFAGLSIFKNVKSEEIPHNEKRGFFVKKSKNKIILTWNQLIATVKPHDEYTFQLTLYPNGTIEYAYKNLPESIKSDLFINYSSPLMIGITPGSTNGKIQRVKFVNNEFITKEPNIGLIEDYKMDVILYLNRLYAPIAYFILSASFFILFAFPVFFRFNLDRPLAHLLSGVEEFQKGKLSTKVPVTYLDEIGLLTQSFNEMAETQNVLFNTLEEKVKLRTAEAIGLTEQNARLNERNHLSRELHDTVNQTLFSATLIADTLLELWEQNPEEAKHALAEIRQLNHNALSEMRLMLFELRPTEFSEQSLGSLLQKMARNFESQNLVSLEILIERDLILPENVQITFFRIAQECLNNIAKHANAPNVEVKFDAVPTQAMLIISDTGKGFDSKDIPPIHLGIQIMKERAELIGASLEIKTAPGKGTSITIIWFKNETI